MFMLKNWLIELFEFFSQFAYVILHNEQSTSIEIYGRSSSK